ncbi:MAG: hypothetical protein GF313_11010 [Caldithrix sp.]|nr:hypothetical protein [Caldithrix sp.]
MMKRFFVFVMILPLTGLSQQDPLSVEEVIRIGLQNNFNIQIALNNKEMADNSTKKGVGGFLPRVNATGSFQYATSDQETNSPFSFGKSTTENTSGQLNMNWTLFDGFRMFARNTQLQGNARLVDAQSKDQIELKVVAILRAYFNLAQQEQLLQINRYSTQISKERLDKEEIRQEMGSASKTDFYNARVAYNNDRAVLLEQQLNLQNAKKDLNVLLGRSPDVKINIKQDITIPPLNLTKQELQDLAQEHNRSLQAARLAKTVAEKNIMLARASFYPQLSLGANYGYSDRTVNSDSEQFSDPISTKSTDASVSLNLAFNLFDGFQNEVDLQNAKLEEKNKKLALKDQYNQVSSSIQKIYETFKKQLEIVELEKENVVAAERNLQLQRDRLKMGTSTSLEFRDAQVNFNRAQIALISAKYQARISHLELERLIGKLTID